MELPTEFCRMLASLGSEDLAAIPQALQSTPTVSLRCNRSKGVILPDCADRVPWCPRSGAYLADRPVFTFIPAMHQGLIYVQDASSMFISHVLQHITTDSRPIRYLDACAAPGGKTTAAIDALPRGSLVVANEYVPLRADVLRENLTKWGYPLYCVTQGDTARFATHCEAFDIIAADVPCSGEGMMRKEQRAVEQWSTALIDECADRQRQIVDNLWPALAPGGHFIYSTCTFNTIENEHMVRYIIDRYGAIPVEIPVDPQWGIHPAIGCDIPAYRFLPGRVRGEGLFMAVLRKPGQQTMESVKPQATPYSEPASRRKRKNTHAAPSPALSADVERWIRPGSATLVTKGDRVMAYPVSQWSDTAFRPTLHIATLGPRGVAIPEQALAMSQLFSPEAFPTAELSQEEAVDYLRCEAIRLPDGTPRGIVLLTHNGRPLGFAKNVGNRANNMYPKQWRILSQRPAQLPNLWSDAGIG